jgi:hypothetical protein
VILCSRGRGARGGVVDIRVRPAVSPVAMTTAAVVKPLIRAELTVPNRIAGPHIFVVDPARVSGAIAPVKIGICPIVSIGMHMHRAVEIGHANDRRYCVPRQREALERKYGLGA